MNAGQAGKLVAKFIGKTWPDDKEEIFEVLRLGINKAWKEGKWFGMTKEGYVKVEYSKDGKYVVGPAENPILLAININGKPQDIRSHHFKFHRNGDGQIKSCNGCVWNTQVYDKGEYPYIDPGIININDGFKVGVRALGTTGPNEKVWINGIYGDGTPVFSYKISENQKDACGCIVDRTKIDTVQGIELDVTQEFKYIDNVFFTDITAITKTITRTPIEVIVFNCEGKAQLMARLLPNQTRSAYRKYFLPDDLCKYNSIHGLFKIAEQPRIVSESDNLIITDEETLISLAKSIDFIFYKGQEDKGATYFLNAVTALEKLKRENESPEIFPIQVDFTGGSEEPPIFHQVF